MTKKLILVELPNRRLEAYAYGDYCVGEEYNDCLDTIESKSLKVDVGKLESIVLEALKKESIRNGNTPHEHGFSKFCSCGMCHTATIASEAMKTALESGELWEEGK